jgi:hypothetical protein
MELSTLVAQHRTAASAYHDHKEKTAYAVATLYITGMSVWLLNESWWTTAKGSCQTLVIAAIVALVTTGLTSSFVLWQLRNRLDAAVLEAACINVGARIVAGEIQDGTAPHGQWRTHLLPQQIVTEIATVTPEQRAQVRTSESLTHGAIALWAVLLLAKIVYMASK